MDKIETNSLLNYLTNMDFSYRDNLNVSDDIKFGSEIEFMVKNGNEHDRDIRKLINLNSSLRKMYKVGEYKKVDSTLKDKRIFEIKTPILSNTKEDFTPLYNVCEGLTKLGIEESNQKGVHVHADLSLLEENKDYLDTFLKLFCIYEHIIFRFSYGNDLESNINVNSYSREVSSKLYNYLNSSNQDDTFSKAISDLRQLFKCKTYAINFHQKDLYCKNETIEIRTFNSTFNPVIIQNYINFVLSMLNKIKSNKVDLDILNYRFNEYNREFYITEPYSKMNLDDAIEFSDLIFTSDLDKYYFLRQYAIKEVPKQKKLVI